MGNDGLFMRNGEPPPCPTKPNAATFRFTHGWKQEVEANLRGANPSNYLPPKNLCRRGARAAASLFSTLPGQGLVLQANARFWHPSRMQQSLARVSGGRFPCCPETTPV